MSNFYELEQMELLDIEGGNAAAWAVAGVVAIGCAPIVGVAAGIGASVAGTVVAVTAGIGAAASVVVFGADKLNKAY